MTGDHQHPDTGTPVSDRIYASPRLTIAGFTFDREVVAVFPDMIKRSVPGYETIIAMTGTLAERYVRPGTAVYDLGCSLGASLLAMGSATADRPRRLIGVDNAKAMVDRCRELLARERLDDVELRCGDIRDTPIADASMVALNFTLQFVPPGDREALLARIWAGLNPGGIVVLSEKVAFEDAHHNALMIDLHHSFKRANGYSELEISQKRSALENVLIPETLAIHRERLRRVGFGSVDVWFQCFNFASLIAIKPE
ncbi:MAG: carboxy-S-adenosyl-L-methionine synthase CmoA [Porticoccaceae bacterium]|nr:carboxy-S-adenosyl-L-methionine synthase CmoA [Porticoccaceae bacterium]MEA3299131.1 carboxy-S-adenosyl-L-methionine synthase CmoA [Pseudomonadota bacterium]HLS97581.1 carboxy-S-adenosyl-L-methionine synthase CmoA [Porticoccaceae bacterium]